ncbi:MAG: hypothetical protein ACI9G1_004218 [Pirellulaceae bacterium]
MLHAVGKNVSSERMLKEAQWAIALNEQLQFDSAGNETPLNAKRQMEIVRAAHLAELKASLLEFEAKMQKEIPSAREQYVHKMENLQRKRSENREIRDYDVPTPFLVAASRRVTQSFHGDKAHQILAAQPLAAFGNVKKYMFEKLADEKFNTKRDRVFLAAEGFKTAREKTTPVLLVLYQGHGHYRDEMNDEDKRRLNSLFQYGPVAQTLKSYVVVGMPIRELAALTNLADVPLYRVESKRSLLMILASPTGNQIAELDGHIGTDELLMSLTGPLNAARLVRAKAELAEGNLDAAAKTLVDCVANLRPADEKVDGSLRSGRLVFAKEREAIDLLVQVNLQRADVKLSAGKKVDALRLLNQTAKLTEDEAAVEQITRRMTEIRSQ